MLKFTLRDNLGFDFNTHAGIRIIAAVWMLICAPATASLADTLGQLKVVVVDSDSGKPVKGVTVTIHDPVGGASDIQSWLENDNTGVLGNLAAHKWSVVVTRSGYKTLTHDAIVTAGTTTEVDFDIAKIEHVVTIKGHRTEVQASTPQASTNRGGTFTKTFATGSGNPGDIKSLLVTTPGIVSSSVGVAHPRGEHAQITYQIGGALLGGTEQGHVNSILSPVVIQNANIMTGSYAPEYGSEAAAIVDLDLKTGPVHPFQTVTMSTGGFNTQYGELAFGGQFGPSLEKGVAGETPKKFRYMFDASSRYTDDSVEPPQPDNQTANNHSTASSIFGDFDYVPDSKSELTLVLNSTPASTEIANRTGLSSKYTPVGQGYGYGGGRNADGYEAGFDPGVSGYDSSNPADSALGAYDPTATSSQQADGQDIYQNDDDAEAVLNYKHSFTPKSFGLLSLIISHSNLDIKNNNPSINLDSFNDDGTLTTTDNSIEFNPTVLRHSSQEGLAGSITSSVTSHTYKFGFLAQDQVADDYDQFIPQSQLAVDALAAATNYLGAYGPITGPQMVPDGAYEAGGVKDVNGNFVYLMAPGATAPIVKTHHQGYYLAEYAQDTWKESKKFTVNYGARLDTYEATVSSTMPEPSVFQSYLSPRLNTSYALSRSSVFRASYNKLFTQPPLSEGALVGAPLKPETLDMYETSIEHQISLTQMIKLDGYYKNIRNQNDSGILIPFTQTGAYTSLQYEYASIHGIELSYDAEPKNNVGLGGYLSGANSLAKPGGVDQTGAPSPIINDHDQRWTISTGLEYSFRSGAILSADNYFGSGEASSELVGIFDNPNVLNGGQRNYNEQLNLRYASAPFLGAHKANWEFDADNVFNNLSVLNFNSGFSGTRFQLGRTLSFKLSFNL